MGKKRIVTFKPHINGHLVGIVVGVVEAIVEQESTVALATITIIDLLTSWNVFDSLDNEALLLINVLPASLSGALMVEHVGITAETVSFESFDADTKDARCNHHSQFTVLFDGELGELGHTVANGVVVSLYVVNLVNDLVEEGTALEPLTLLLGVEDGEVLVLLGQNVDVFVEV